MLRILLFAAYTEGAFLLPHPLFKHSLNMAEIEFSVLTRQCLDRRIPNKEILKQEVAAP